MGSGEENKYTLAIFPCSYNLAHAICICLVAREAGGWDDMSKVSGLKMCVVHLNSLYLATIRGMSHRQEWVSHLHHNLRLNYNSLETTTQHQHHHKEFKFEERDSFHVISSRGTPPHYLPGGAEGVCCVVVVIN